MCTAMARTHLFTIPTATGSGRASILASTSVAGADGVMAAGAGDGDRTGSVTTSISITDFSTAIITAITDSEEAATCGRMTRVIVGAPATPRVCRTASAAPSELRASTRDARATGKDSGEAATDSAE